ncbi:MAG: hypothetical protein ACTIJN_11240, partial [Microbacterium gubbeenense]
MTNGLPPRGPAPQAGRPRMTLQGRLMITIFAIVAAIMLVISLVTGVVLSNVLNGQADARANEALTNLKNEFGIGMLDGTAKDQLQAAQAAPGTLLVIVSPFTGTTGAVVGTDYERYALNESQMERILEATKTSASSPLTTVTIPGIGGFRVGAIAPRGSGETIGVFGLSTAGESATLRQMLWAIGFATIGGMLLLG